MSNSAIGNVADLQAGQILLPSFVIHQDDGLFVDLTAVDSPGLVMQFAGRVFSAGARFVDLDYELFLNLMFLWEPQEIDRRLEEFRRHNKAPRLRLAQDIVAFPEERRTIYHGVKIGADGKSAEYIFEPAAREVDVDDPSAPDGSGRRKVVERLYADFDEFVAALWEKGVRYGIDAKAVREAIGRDKAERLIIATAKAPDEGKDAGVDEQTDLLHRDDAPRLLPDGRMDLRHYRNRFPQVSAGTRLFKKLGRTLGHSGWDVQGKELPPALVKDFDLTTLAGPGTQLLRDAAGEYVVAARDGFLDIDAKSNQISVLDKIISREGVSMRTTGDLALAGDEFEEHGEVQERRVVEGHHMTFLADVFGHILSDGGRITFKQSISGGSAKTPNGSILVEGSASRAQLEAPGGEIVVTRAEGCHIVAAQVRIERAVNCDIVADAVIIEQSEGCAIAAKQVSIKNSSARKDDANVVVLRLPDLSRFDLEHKTLKEAQVAARAQAAKAGAVLQGLAAQPDMKSYLAIQPKLKAKTLIMTPTQQKQWEALLDRVAPQLRQFAALNGEFKTLREYAAGVDAEIAAVLQARRDASQGISCTIETVSSDTRVRTLCLPRDAIPLVSLPPKELHKTLRLAGAAATALFAAGSGSFEWQPPQDDNENPEAAAPETPTAPG